MIPEWAEDMELAGPIQALELSLASPEPQIGRKRHRYGNGPFARLKIPPLPNQPGIYVWEHGGSPVYVGRATTTLPDRLGPKGYSTISRYNTYAPKPEGGGGGQQTNCRINALANEVLKSGDNLNLWIRVTPDAATAAEREREWMRQHGMPPWNLRREH